MNGKQQIQMLECNTRADRKYGLYLIMGKGWLIIMSFHSIHNVVDRGVLQAMSEKLADQVGRRDQLANQ